MSRIFCILVVVTEFIGYSISQPLIQTFGQHFNHPLVQSTSGSTSGSTSESTSESTSGSIPSELLYSRFEVSPNSKSKAQFKSSYDVDDISYDNDYYIDISQWHPPKANDPAASANYCQPHHHLASHPLLSTGAK